MNAMNAMKQIKRTQAYQATDGTFFDSKNECVEHQKCINIEEGIGKIALRAQTELGVDSLKMSLFLLKNGSDINAALVGGFIEDMLVNTPDDTTIPGPLVTADSVAVITDFNDLNADVSASVCDVQSVVTELEAA